MENGCVQKLRVVFAISPLKQQVYVTFCQKPANSNGLIVVKLERDVRYRGYV